MAHDRFSLAGKTALVTGASSGLGQHFAHTLATAGAKVALAARRRDRLEALAEEIRAGGGDLHTYAVDSRAQSTLIDEVNIDLKRYGTPKIDQHKVPLPPAKGPAEVAEIQPGDVITEVAGQRVGRLADLFRAIWRQGPAGTELSAVGTGHLLTIAAPSDGKWWLYPSNWILVTANKSFLRNDEIRLATKEPEEPSRRIPLWTDDYVSLFTVLK
jgi:hypothetical protein